MSGKFGAFVELGALSAALCLGICFGAMVGRDTPSTASRDDSTRDVVTRLQLRPGETLRLAQPIGAFDVTCSAGAEP